MTTTFAILASVYVVITTIRLLVLELEVARLKRMLLGRRAAHVRRVVQWLRGPDSNR